MLRSLEITNFTAFRRAELHFSPGLNVIVGDNGLGKTHLLKLPYAVMTASAEEGKKPGARGPTKTALQRRLAEKLIGVFRPESLGRLARRRQGLERCEVRVTFRDDAASIGFAFATRNKSGVDIMREPDVWCDRKPVFLPTRELLTIYPGFVPLYEMRKLEFDETWRDTCLLLGSPAPRGPRNDIIKKFLKPLEKIVRGHFILEGSGRFYLRQPGSGTMEMHLIAEGWRKIGMLARLVATGSLDDGGCLFWDEPEANLNFKQVEKIAAAILGLCKMRIQIILATHSLFLLRELEILLQDRKFQEIDQRYFALRRDGDGVEIAQGETMNDMDPLLLVNEDLKQSDRFLEVFNR